MAFADDIIANEDEMFDNAERYKKLCNFIREQKLISIYKGHNRVNYCLIADDIHLTGKTLDDIIDQLPS